MDCHAEEKDTVIASTTIEWMPSDSNKHQIIKHIDFVILPILPNCPPCQIFIQYGGLLKQELIARGMFQELIPSNTLENIQIVLIRQ